MTRTILPFILLVLLSACSQQKVSPEPETEAFKEGVIFLDQERVQSAFCYAYGADEGKLSARQKVKEIALREAIEASSVRIMSMFEQSTECTTSEAACKQREKSYFRQVSNSFYNDVKLDYQDIAPYKVCVIATGKVVKVKTKEKPKRCARIVTLLNKDFRNDPKEPGRPYVDRERYIQPALVTIEEGSFKMGSEAKKSTRPIHAVSIHKAFDMGKYEVTKAEFRRFIKSTHYKTDAEKLGNCIVYNGKHLQQKGLFWDALPFFQGDNEPVVCVSYNDAQNYVKWLNQESQQQYRLPTEAEWEYAARAGTETLWSFGDDKKAYSDHAWYAANSSKQTHPVGTKKVNPWGLYDMSGNVWEWCEDSYEPYTLENGETAKVSSNTKVLRGGAWVTNITPIASRWAKPSQSRYYAIGFRVARERQP